MLTNIINKVIFDVHCKNEATAGLAGREIQNYTWIRMNSILEKVMERFSKLPGYYRFDKIEIDLGSLTLKGMETDEVLRRFEFMLEEKINSSSPQTANITESQADWEILKTWLLLGDLPWWVDKKLNRDMNEMVKRFISTEPEKIKSFVEEHGQNPAVMRRLLPVQRELQSIQSIKQVLQNRIPAGIVRVLIPVFEKNQPVQKHEPELVGRLLKAIPANIKHLDPERLSAAQAEIIRLISSTGAQNKNRLFQLLKELPQSQLKKLLFGNDNKLFNKYNAPHPPIEVRRKLTALLDGWKAKKETRKKMVGQVLACSFFFKDHLPELLMEHEPEYLSRSDNRLQQKFMKAWKKAGRELRLSIKRLSSSEKLLYKKLSTDGHAGKRKENQLVKKILDNLSDQSLSVLSLLTELPEKEMKQLRLPVPETAIDTSGQILIENGGLCLLANYLPVFFNNLGYLKNKKFRNSAYQAKAVCLLEYLASGEKTFSEYRLQFNRLLCGFAADEIITLPRKLTKKEYAEADGLLQAVIDNWKALKNTSLSGFRTSFLQRKAILVAGPRSWILRVEKTGIDLLLGSLQWSYNMIRLPWMEKMIEVEW